MTWKFRRVENLPPYVFATVDKLKIEARHAGEDIVDMGFGNPDLPSPDIAISKLRETVLDPKNHRYSVSRGIPHLREAIVEHYAKHFQVELDFETEVCSTIGAKEGYAHLMWVLLQPGDAVLAPSPSYPIHFYAPLFAGGEVRTVPLLPSLAPESNISSAEAGQILLEDIIDRWEYSVPKPKVIVLSFPHNPTTACVDLSFMQSMVDFAREHGIILVHDFAYADLAFDGYKPPSILQAKGAKEVAVEIYSMTKSFSMAGWRVGFLLGNPEIVAALAKLKSYLDYGTFQPIQIAATVALHEAPEYPMELNKIYQDRRDFLCDGLNKIGWEVTKPQGTMFVWAPIPEPYKEMGSIEFCMSLIREAKMAVSPGIGFGEEGEGYVRFALIENEQRIAQAIRTLEDAFESSAIKRS